VTSPSAPFAEGGAADIPEVERIVLERTAGLEVDHGAMAVVSNLSRLSTAIRRRMERTVLAGDGLSWTAFVVLWVLWIWGEMESRDLASAVGITKPTSSGVVRTLERRGLVQRQKGADDGRMVRVSLTDSGRRLIEDLFPRFNAEEARVAAPLDPAQQDSLARLLRSLLNAVEDAT